MTQRRTLQRSLSTTTRGLSQFGSGGVAPSYDTDAQAYITAVEAADSQSLETSVKDAINAFVVGCKADGIWTAIKASCILAGARTLTGALVPLVGTAPTNNNFVSGDYSRTAGLTGNGSTKYLDSNRANNADPQNSSHIAVYASSGGTLVYAGASVNSPASFTQLVSSAGGFVALNSAANITTGNFDTQTGLVAGSRISSSQIEYRFGGTTTTAASTSVAKNALDTFIFARNYSPLSPTNATLAFYSIGEAIDLALLDSRVTTLITDIGTALA